MLLYRVQFLLGDNSTLSPSPFPSLRAIVLIAAGLTIDLHVLVPYKIIADNFESHRVHEQTVLLDLLPSNSLDHCVKINGNF